MTQTVEATFTGSGGRTRAGRLQLPDGVAEAYALLAHCFPGGLEDPAADHLAAALLAEGIAVLQVEVSAVETDSGDLDSSAAQDLLQAAGFLRSRYSAPSLLVGHSFGGTAALAAAGRIPELRAVATLGAPSKVRRRHITGLHRPLLILHSPTDSTVGIVHAGRIFAAARHPKSFISLDGTDHLLTGRGQAARAAGMIAAWAVPYLDKDGAGGRPAAEDGLEPGLVTVEENGTGRFGQTIRAGRHTWLADEPLSLPGAADSGPSPYDLLLAGLGACTSMTVRLYAERKGIPLDKVRVALRQKRVHASDCENCENVDGHITLVTREISITGNLTDEQRAGLLRIADKCPVHRTLDGHVEVVTRDVS